MKFNDEEKEAIEYMKKYVDSVKQRFNEEITTEKCEYYKSILNLIEKLDLEQASAKAERDVIKEKAEEEINGLKEYIIKELLRNMEKNNEN